MDLLSEALKLSRPEASDVVRSDPIGATIQRCVQAFGVKPERIKVYEVR